jgi:pimeloyl-ACP methyl ester carboxylesterase
MPTEVIMPKVDMDMATGKVAGWHVEEGANVKKGDALFDIETDKAAMEVESPASGVLRHILAQPGDEIAVGRPVAWIFAEGEAPGDLPPSTDAALPEPPAENVAEPDDVSAEALGAEAAAPADAAAETAAVRPRATPAARRQAREAKIALADVSGTGPNARIEGSDVVAFLNRGESVPGGGQAPAAPRETQPFESADPARALCEPSMPEAEGAAVPAGWTPQPGPLAVTRSRGGEGTPIVLLHGFAADGASWQPLERMLEPGRPIWRIDLPGHGRSPRRRIDDFPALARAVVEAFDAADLGQVHLVGHSLGGAVALALADIRPRRVASLTLISPAGLGPDMDAAILAGIARASRAESLAPWLKRLTARPESIGWDFVKSAMLSRLDPALRAVQVEMAEALFPDGVPAFDLTAALERLDAPTAIVWGRQDKVLPWRHALSAPGRVALHFLNNVGHVPHLEAIDALSEIIRRQVAAAPELTRSGNL